MAYDEGGFAVLLEELVEESADTHADAMRSMAGHLDELVEIGQSTGSPADVQILQTSASIENLAVATYKVALTLPFVGGSTAIPIVNTFARQTMSQHSQHAKAFNAAIVQLAGTPQHRLDPVLNRVVQAAVPNLSTPGAVVALAIELENAAAATYVHATSALSNKNARSVTASIMGVEAQHVAVLLSVQELLQAGDASLIALPPRLDELPAAFGNAGFPNAFYSTVGARPAAEGAAT